ncbi:LacI family DNA-binding transcriptional regulator [Oscillatoria sp. FACHB-1407]|uniref:LacI family DNA-binding transcriptional regulator n=1 Tax=Oscillatoria sp. FACHB-1407 TaxID=2692847 RepID=UPI0016836738|nr:LacI family DNA-binding transcriptional regulator [Oscillatoria sp. FACHB-1407]MBD2463474.1 LacI family DNA-binding transcriptional regulator [Oscillatoria sp. FACHB-1407]
MTFSDSPKPATLLDIAKALGISRTTVSNAFNRPDQLSPELREKILVTAKEMGYAGPNPTARLLRTGQAGAIGVIFHESLLYAFSDPVAIAFLQGIASVCEPAKVSLLIVPMAKDGLIADTVNQAVVDGFIVYSTPDADITTAKVLERHLPTVAVDRPGLTGVPSVGIDEHQAAHEATSHLIRLGHTRLGIISMELQADGYEGKVDDQRMQSTTFPSTLDRLHGYLDALREAGIDPQTVAIEERLNREESGFSATLALLNQTPRPTAILAMSDRLAVGALRAAETLGLHVPKDLSIVGFDDIPLASQIRPRLTTVRQPLVEKGAVAARLLLESVSQPISYRLPTELVIRDSSGVAPKE